MCIILYIVNNELGKNIRVLRKQKGWTQTDLAQKLNCSQELVGAYERGTRKPPADKLPTVAKVLGININELYNIPVSKKRQPENSRLLKKIRTAERLPAKAQKQISDYINLLLKANNT